MHYFYERCQPAIPIGRRSAILVLLGLLHYIEVTVVVLDESPRPRGSSRTKLQVLVLVLGPQVLVLGP